MSGKLKPLMHWSLGAAAVLALLAPAAAAESPRTPDPDEAEMLQNFENADVWHFPVDYLVAYNNQDVVVTRELVAKPEPAGQLCFIRFDVVSGEGDFSYGLKPAEAAGPRKATEWGVHVLKRGTVTNQLRSALKMNVVYFYGEGAKSPAAADFCVKKQSAGAYKGEWSELVVRAKLIHGWPPEAQR